MARIPQLRQGLTREDLLKGTCYENYLAGHHNYQAPTIQAEAIKACLQLLDRLIAYANAGNRVTRKDITKFFVAVSNFAGIRASLNNRLTDGELTPTLLDELVKDI